METLFIAYKNGTSDLFNSKQLDCSNLTIRGHASRLVDAWAKGHKGVFEIDRYNAVQMDDIKSIAVRTVN